MKNTYPVNYIVLFLYTGVMGVFLGFICTSYFAAGWGDQVLMAAGITVVKPDGYAGLTHLIHY